MSGLRFIPVGTGNALGVVKAPAMQTVYPRGYGERDFISIALDYIVGLSPWVRGTQRQPKKGIANLRFIPVGTGNAIVLDL